jgi:hypothetical protein
LTGVTAAATLVAVLTAGVTASSTAGPVPHRPPFPADLETPTVAQLTRLLDAGRITSVGLVRAYLNRSPGSADTAKHAADRAQDLADSKDRIDAVMAANDVTALLFAGSGSAGIGAKAGYPSITVPAGYQAANRRRSPSPCSAPRGANRRSSATPPRTNRQAHCGDLCRR